MLTRILLLGAAASAHALHSHSRPSLNHGANTPRKLSASAHDGTSTVLNSFNAASTISTQSNRDGIAIAHAFLSQLHPKQEFRLQSRSQSAGGSVVHAYFVQTVGGRDVIDGLVNVNIDITTGSVIGFGDSAFVPKTVEACGGAFSVSSRKQVVFGSSSSADNKECITSASATVDIEQAPIDPRLAISSFLLHAAPSFTAKHASLDDLVDRISISQSINGDVNDIKLLNVPGAVEDVPAKLSYVQREDNTLALTWSFEYESNDNWYEAHVSAASDAHDVTTPLMVVDWVRDSSHGGKKEPSKPVPALEYSYHVFPWGTNDPSEGKREYIASPADKEASPLGWHQVGAGAGRDSGKKGNSVTVSPSATGDDSVLSSPGWSNTLKDGATFKDTRGNNVFAQDNPSGGTSFELNYRPQHNETGAFDYKLGWGSRKEREGKHIDPKTYLNVSITELFYTINEIHDLTWHYGFDEISGNFQENNYGRGGLGGDGVVAMAQDGSGMNNANFATPPDGQRPRMRMYVWNAGEPYADGDLEAGIVIHEYTHGISTRLVGGPANSGCLGWGEAGGMGEGYGDFLATMIRMHDAKIHDYNMGSWAAHRAGGIRPHPYSTNKTVNPDVYTTLSQPGYWGVHAIGSVYAEFLFEVAEALIAKHGWTPSLFPHAANTIAYDDFYTVSAKTGRKHPTHGNTYVIQLLMDSFKLSPCRPGFLDHRDAILQADKIYTGGENTCTIWKAYAKRGLGPNASLKGSTPWGGGHRENDFGVPKDCIGK